MKKNSRKCIRQKTLSFFVASAVGCSQVLSLIPVNTIAAEDAPAAQVSADVLYGDANNDGKVNNTDAALIEKYVRYDNMYTVDSAAADVDLDGTVTLSDAELVYQLNNAQISALPYTGDITWSTYPDPANYEIINTGITWQKAENYCEDKGGHLAVITTEKEQIMIESIIKSQEARKNNYWIGLMRYNENDFDWITAESMNYTNWHPGNPGNYGVDQNAVLFYGNDFVFGEWDDISDSGNCEGSSYYGLHNFGFILEKDGTPVSDYHLWKDPTCLPTSGKYKLDCDVTSSKITVNEFLDLDLNGHTVSIERVNCYGDVTITDTSEEQRGAMIASSSGTLLDIDGSLTLSGGTFIGNPKGVDVATIGVNGRGCFTLDGAKVVSYSSNALSLRSSRGTTNIIRGELYTEGNHNSIPDNFSTIYMNKNYTGTLNISGGNIVSEYTSGIYCESNNGTVNISGGKIEGKDRYGFYAPNGTALNLSGNCNIKGGIAGIYVPEDKKINITGNIVSFDTSVTSPVSGVITSGWAEFADAQFIPEGINGSVIVDADGELYFRSEEDDPDIPPVTTTPTTTSSTTTTTTTTTTTRAPFSPVTTEYNPRIEETIDEEKNERLQITGELTAKQMTPDEIESAGFDVEVPDNYHYFNYSVEFTFHDEPIIFTKYEAVPISPGNHVTTPVPKIVYPNSEPVGPGESVYIPEINATATYFEYEEQEMFLIIYGESKWLKEFFDVQLIVMNTDNETLEDCSATLDVPEGLTLCNSEQTQLIGDLLPYDVKNIHWYLRGDIAGEYNISVLSEGKNDGEIFSYPFYSENDIHVYAGDALKMTIETHGYSCFGSEYPICISMKNVSDKPIYQLQNKIKNVEHGYYNYKHIYNGGISSDIETKVPLGGSVTKTIDVDELLPGESAVIEISITDMWKSPLQKELDNSKLYVDAFSLLLGKSPISAFIANYTSQFIEGITVVHVLDSYVVNTLKNSITKVPYEIVINDNLNEIGEDNTFGFVDAIECSIMDQAPNEVKRIYAAGKCFESGFEFRSDFKANLLEDWQKVENGEMSRESFDKKYDKEYNDYIFGNAGNEATVSGFDMAGHLEVGKDIYKIVSIPSDVTTATAYVTDADGNNIDKDSSRQDVMGKIHTAEFEFEILNGGFEYNDGVYTFYEDSLIRLRANSANKTYYVHFVTDDGREEVFSFISIPEHDCTAERYYVVSGTGSGTEGLAMQFCEVCNKPLKTRRIPSSFNAMLSDGQMFQNIYQAAAFAGENYDEVELSIFGDITLDKDLVIPENVKLIITPFANITLKNSAHIVVDGEYKDFSTDMDTEIYENIVLNYWDGRTETMPVKYGTEVTELPVLSETCGFTGWYTDAEFTEPFVPFTSGDKNHSKVYYADVHHSFDTSGQCSVCGEIKNGMDAFRKVALSIDDDIEILYHVALTEKALADNQFRVTFEASDGTTKTQYLSDAVDNGDGTYTFSYSIPYNKFDENIRAQVCYSNNVKGSYLDYSAKKYADSILENSDQFDEVTVNNIKALVNFSGYVQIFAGTAPEDAVNADLGMPLDDVDPEIGDEFNAVKNINSDSISIAAANLSMDKLTNINIKFNISAGANVNDYIFTVDGKTVTPKQSGSSYLVTMEGISPLNFDKMYLFKAESKSDASDFVSVEYSCLTYAKKIIETSSDANVVNAMKALYFYSQEAEKYISKTKED